MRFPEEFAKKIILDYTKKGDVVLDPFCGFGTTILVGKKLGRVGIGMEVDSKKTSLVEKKLKLPSRIINDSAQNILKHKIPKCDFLLTRHRT